MHRVVFVLTPTNPQGPTVDEVPARPEVPPGVMARDEPSLVQWVALGVGRVEARYHFDDDYVAAHPEALDPRHLAMLHALLTFKLFDDGEVVVPPRQVEGALRWPSRAQPRRSLADA